MVLALTLAAAAPLPGWRPVGPERGHVMDAAVLPDALLVLSRPGVLRAGLDLKGWARDPRFPPNTQHLALAEDGAVWADTPGRLWRVTDHAVSIATLPPGAGVVDLAAVSGAVVAAIRGEEAGIYRYNSEGAAALVLPDVDPWTVAVSEATVWVGTLDHGLYRSFDGGLTYQPVTAGSVSAILPGGAAAPVVGWADGRVTQGDTTLCTSTDGPAVAMGRVAGSLYLVLDGPRGPRSPPVRCEPDGTVRRMEEWLAQEDVLSLSPTGFWPLAGDRLLMGTFRAGPIVIDRSGARFAREGFRATLTSAVAAGPGGELLLALMSTGIYGTNNDGKSWESVTATSKTPAAPVSDVMDLVAEGERITVVDFEGVTVGRKDVWYRSAGVPDTTSGRPNGLVELGVGVGGALWARDLSGQLWRRSAAGWERCAEANLLRLEGEGSRLRVATADGYATPGECVAGAAAAVWPDIGTNLEKIRSDGLWAAGNGQLWRDGVPQTKLPPGAIEAVASRVGKAGEEVLVATAAHQLLRCSAGSCEAATRPLPGPVVALGWFADGRIWAAEARGSLLVADGKADLPPVADYSSANLDPPRLGTDVRAPLAQAGLSVPPWRMVGRANVSGTVPATGPVSLPGVSSSPEGPKVSGEAGETEAAASPASAAERRRGGGAGPTGLGSLALGVGLGVGVGALGLAAIVRLRGRERRPRRGRR